MAALTIAGARELWGAGRRGLQHRRLRAAAAVRAVPPARLADAVADGADVDRVLEALA